jgi:hypothetical protein
MISKSISTIKLDPLSARRIDENYYIGNGNDLAGNQIINIHPVVALEKGSSLINAISIYDQAGDRSSKWLEPSNVAIGNAQLWTKLNGITSTHALRVLTILGDWYQYFNRFDDAGTFGMDPNQINDQGDGSKIVVTGLGSQSAVVGLNFTFKTAYSTDAWQVVYPPTSHHIYISPTGIIYLAMSFVVAGSATSKAILMKSDDGGATWTIFRVNTNNTYSQDETSFAADKNGNLHFTWNEVITSTDWRIKYVKFDTKTETFGTIGTINTAANKTNYGSIIQVAPDGLSMCVAWMGKGYGTNTNYSNVLVRVVNPNGSFGAISAVTTNGAAAVAYVSLSMDYDSLGYRHIVVDIGNATGTEYNTYYIRETGGGWDAPDYINSDVGDDGITYCFSHVLVNKKDEAIVAYSLGSDVSTNYVHMKKIVDGTVGAKTTVTNDGNLCQIQIDSYNQVIVVYANHDNTLYKMQIVAADFLDVGTPVTIFTGAAGRHLSQFHIPWSIYPNLSGVNVNIPQQGMMMFAVDYETGTLDVSDVKIHFSGRCVLGAPVIPSGVSKYTYNIRGAINRSKFNSGFNPSI